DAATEPALRWFERLERLFERQVVGHHEHVDVTRGVVGMLGNRAVERSEADLIAQRSERGLQHLWHAGELLDDRAQLFEDRRVVVRAVALLLPEPRAGDDAACGKAFELALHRAST